MKKEAFRVWMKDHTNNSGTIGGIISRCERVEKVFGNLDLSFEADQLEATIRNLSYTKQDERGNKLPPSGLTFRNGASIFNGMASLKNAVTLYRDFKRRQNDSSVTITVECQHKDFDDRISLFGKWLVDEARLKAKAASCYKVYIRKLQKAVDKEFGQGWFESLASNRENCLSCSAFIESKIRTSSVSDRKIWRNFRSAYHRLEEFLYGYTDSLNGRGDDYGAVLNTNEAKYDRRKVKQETLCKGFVGSILSDTIVATYNHDELRRVFESRLKTQSRYYPRFKLLFPPRLITRIFRQSQNTAWSAWLREGVENMRILTSCEGTEESFSNVKKIEITGDGTVIVTTRNNSSFEMWTRTADGRIVKQIARQGLRDISIDHIKPFERVLCTAKAQLRGLKRLTDLFVMYKRLSTRRPDERTERVWVDDFFKSYKGELDTNNMRSLIEGDLRILKHDYELMDCHENSKKGKRG